MTDKDLSLLRESNETAFYVFDGKVLKERVEYIRSSLPANTALCYAVKANPFISKEIIDDVERFEICSPGEAEICFELGIPSDKMVISGIYKTPSFIEGLAADSSFNGIFTAESLVQYRQLCQLSEKYKRKMRVLPRLTNDSQFGMNDTDIIDIIDNREKYPDLDIVGIQYFSGTQKTSLKKFKRELEHLDKFLSILKEEHGFEAKELEYGTGFPVSYFEGDDLDEAELFKGFSELLTDMTNKPDIILELGRSIAASCGRYYTHVVDIKTNKRQNYALIDGGMHHIVYFGQHMAMKQPFFSVVGKEITDSEKLWTICGSLCSMNDIVVKQVPLPDIAIGDLVCFENAGAYCMTEGISLLLSRDLPAVYIIDKENVLYKVRSTFETKALNTPRYERMY